MLFSSWLRSCKQSLERRWALHQSLRQMPSARRPVTRPRLESLEDRYLLSAYTVTLSTDNGSGTTPGTLSYAIDQVNAGNYNQINFQIGTAGSAQTISLTGALPALTASGVYIDGLSQGGGGLITLNGSGAGASSDGLLLQGSNNSVSGLQIKNFKSNGIEVSGSANTIGGSAAARNAIYGNGSDGILIDSGGTGNVVEGNFIGTGYGGGGAVANSGNGIELRGTSNTVGGSVSGAGNLISGNILDGILLGGGATGHNAALGNSIGTNAAVTSTLGNSGNGIEACGSNNTIGGTISAAFDYIGGNAKDGILIDSGATGTLVLGNRSGGFLSGGAGGNSVNGLEIAGSSNTIGGVPEGSNIISGNGNDGVLIDSSGSNNQVLGNSIGTNSAGTVAVANSVNGVEVAGNSNTIGGTTSGASNVIGGNRSDGILIDSGSTGNMVQGNNIGVLGTAVVANSVNGVEVAGSSNTIGGTTSAARNVIGGNGNDGILIDSGGTGNSVQGNYIGINFNVIFRTIANGSNGVEVLGAYNTVGGSVSGAGNLVSGNIQDGIVLGGNGAPSSGHNLVQGNYVGTDPSGPNFFVGNSGSGIEVLNQYNTIGGTAAAARNVISANLLDGILINSGASFTQVLNNYIGVNASGTAALGNSTNGVDILSSSNTVGSTAAAGRNLISANLLDGVLLEGTSSANVVEGNYIGTNAAGSAAIANSVNGVEVQGSGNIVGASVTGARNVISGNAQEGVEIDVGESKALIQGNYIGTNANGSAALGNANNGIHDYGTSDLIGGTTTLMRNVISGNAGDGVLLDAAFNPALEGNYIGTNAAGTNTVGNSGNGVEVVNGYNMLIGGNNAPYRNIISGDSNDGVLIDSSSSYIRVQGNFIGTDYTGSIALANSNGVEVASNNNTIGSIAGAARNLISGNSNDGLLIDSSGSGNVVQGNYIGINNGGTGALANNNGIEVAGSNNIIGGTAAGARNIISGNYNDGVLNDSNGNSNVVEGNYIGTTPGGTAALTNYVNGVEVAGNSNTIGGTSSGARNIISGNGSSFTYFTSGGYSYKTYSGEEVLIDSSGSGTQVLGNYIGTNSGGLYALTNSRDGVDVYGTNTTIGGTLKGAGNVISGHVAGFGVYMGNGASGLLMLGNSIGTNAMGTGAIANFYGVDASGPNVTIGGTTSAARNIISGNQRDGILIGSSVLVEGNYIGTNAAGTSALGNGYSGVEVAGVNDTLGGTTTGAGNVISGNTTYGVAADSSEAAELMVQGDFIGTNAAGNSAVANGTGIYLGAQGNDTIGGTTSAARNIISGNRNAGVQIGTSSETIEGNYIGTDVSAYFALGNSIGIDVAGGAGNTLGGTASGAGNTIGFNTSNGVQIDSYASGTLVQGNAIGRMNNYGFMPNGGYGVSIAGSNNTIGGSVAGADNTIADNKSGGVLVSAGSGNTISQNDITANGSSNTGPGITLASGANNNLAAPTINTATLSGTTLTVTGTYTAPTANVTYVLEFFANPTGDAEGATYLGSQTVTPTSTGSQSFTFPVTFTQSSTPLITVTLTDNLGDTSQFSAGVLDPPASPPSGGPGPKPPPLPPHAPPVERGRDSASGAVLRPSPIRTPEPRTQRSGVSGLGCRLLRCAACAAQGM